MQNYTIDELAEMVVDTVLAEQFLNKQTLMPVVKALIRTMVDLKNIPKDYNEVVNKTVQAKRLRALEQRKLEIKFWMNLVKELDPENMDKYYKQQTAMLVAKGYLEV